MGTGVTWEACIQSDSRLLVTAGSHKETKFLKAFFPFCIAALVERHLQWEIQTATAYMLAPMSLLYPIVMYGPVGGTKVHMGGTKELTLQEVSDSTASSSSPLHKS